MERSDHKILPAQGDWHELQRSNLQRCQDVHRFRFVDRNDARSPNENSGEEGAGVEVDVVVVVESQPIESRFEIGFADVSELLVHDEDVRDEALLLTAEGVSAGGDRHPAELQVNVWVVEEFNSARSPH